MNAIPPKARRTVVDNIPSELKAIEQWAAWRWERRGGKWTKPPINPATGGYARNNDPATWGSFEGALKLMHERRLSGVGFMFHPEDGFAGVDLDSCRDPRSGRIKVRAQKIIDRLGSYAEVSPSSTGVKVFLRGALPPGRRREGNVEMYDRGRFFATTGHRLPEAPPNAQDRQEELIALHRRIFGEPTKTSGIEKSARRNPGRDVRDGELLERATRAANGDKFARLWGGDTSEYGSDGNEGCSEADLALCSLLAFWAGPDAVRIDALFRKSGLMRTKWDEIHYADGRTYGQAAIEKALDGKGEFWSGGSAPIRAKVYARRKGVISIG